MTTQPHTETRQHRLERSALLERHLKQERIDLIRAMAARIDAPDVIESHACALVRIQERLEAVRQERTAASA
jgi:hypothetical protein